MAALTRGLIDHDIEAFIACPSESSLTTDPLLGPFIIPTPMERTPRPTHDWRAVRQLRSTIETHDIDLVHTHSAKGGVVGRIAARQAGRPSVHTPHAWSFWVTSNPILRGLFRRVEDHLQPHTATTICLSRAELDEMTRFRRPSPAVTIANGMAAPPSFRPIPRTSQIRIGTIGRLSHQKGLDVLIEAIRLLDNPDLAVTIAGDGPDRSKLERLAVELGCAHQIDFIGSVDRPWNTLANLDLFVMPSRWEGMPLVLLEALVAGVPAVATDVGGVRELIPTIDHGRIVPVDDAPSLANAIASLAGDGHRRALTGLTGQAHAVEHFSHERTVEQTASLYRRLVPGHATHHDLYLTTSR